MAIKIGITGGIGSGKSVVSQLLEIMGIPIYDSDTEAKRIIHTHPDVRKELCGLVGNELFQNNELDRQLLAAYLFGQPEHARQVNQIVHPKVKEDFRQWASLFSPNKIVGIESAILLEAGFKEEVDSIIMVYAPLEVRIERAIKRDHAAREQIIKRIEAQMSDEAKRGQADFILLNDGKTALIPQVLRLISLLSKNNHYLCPQK